MSDHVTGTGERVVQAPLIPAPTRLAFTIPGEPRGQADKIVATKNRNGDPLPFPTFRLDPKDEVYRKTVQAYALAARPAGWAPLTGPVRLTIHIAATMRKADQRKTEMRPALWKDTMPDCKNVYRGIEDALIRIAYVDDSQVADVRITKIWARQGVPGATRVIVESLEGAPSL